MLITLLSRTYDQCLSVWEKPLFVSFAPFPLPAVSLEWRIMQTYIWWYITTWSTRVWYKPASRARVGQSKPALKPEAQLRAEGQVFIDPNKLWWQVYHSWLNLWEGFSWPAFNHVWKISLTCDVSQKYQWDLLLRGQLAQVSEILQTFWRPGQEKPFIFVQTLYSGGQRGSQRLSQESR